MLLGRLLSMLIRIATRADELVIDELLASAKLPMLDRAVFQPGDFRIAEDGALAIAAVGIERYESDGLLRSLVVAPQARGQGVGESLVSEIENHAYVTGLNSLCLLTTTADTFFRRFGYEFIQRIDMPAAVQRSSEFSTLCPASAVCMRKMLNGGVS